MDAPSLHSKGGKHRCKPAGREQWPEQAAEKLNLSERMKNGTHQDATGTIRAPRLMVFHPLNFALSPYFRTFSAACLAPESWVKYAANENASQRFFLDMG